MSVAGRLVALAFAAALAVPAHAQDEAARLMGELMSGTVQVGSPFSLPDTEGHERSIEEFQGRLVLLYFGYLSCPDVCPTDLARIAGALRELGPESARVQPVFVTIDPEHDSAAAVGEYVRAFDARFVALRGSPAETRRIARSFKVAYERRADGLLDHAAFTFLLDTHGRYVAFFPPGTPSVRMAQMLRAELAESALQRSQNGPGRGLSE